MSMASCCEQRVIVRKAFRLCTFCVLVVAFYLVILLFNWRWARLIPTPYSYDSERLEIVVSSCDVEVKSGTGRIVEVNGLLGTVSQSITFASQSVVRILNVNNAKDCRDQASLHCAKVCKVVVSVPESEPPDQLWVMQKSDDKADHVLLNVKGVTLKNLRIRGAGGNSWNKAGPSLAVNISDATITGYTYITLDGGPAVLKSCTLGGAVDIRSVNSVVMDNVEQAGPVSLSWRQPMNQVCLTGGGGRLALPDPKGLFGLCQSSSLKTFFQKFYDTNKDFFLDSNEFGAKLPNLPLCCGGSCPHAGSCSSLQRQLFPMNEDSSGGASLESRSGILPAATVWNTIEKLGLPGLIPKCFREAQFKQPLVQSRNTVEFIPVEPKAQSTAPASVTVFASCMRHSDCNTGYCNAATFKCGVPPAAKPLTVAYSNWSTCDRPCGGGQQVRTFLCVGSDGLSYPNDLCPSSLQPQVQTCNTRPCDLPGNISTLTVGDDEDLRPNWVSLRVFASLPTGATSMQVRFGSASGAVADNVLAEVQSADCEGESGCDFYVKAELPDYADRMVVLGANADGTGTGSAVQLMDRVGEPTAIAKSFTLESSSGIVRVHLKVDGDNMSWAPENRLDGIRLYGPDAKRLMSEIGPKLGDPDSTDHGFVVIDTVPSPGVPATRWVYTTRPAYMAINPPHLEFLSGGLLTPKVYNYRVGFIDAACSASSDVPILTEESLKTDEMQARLIEMSQQLKNAFRSNGWATAVKIRGDLYLLAPHPSSSNIIMSPSLWEFKTDTSGVVTPMKVEDLPLKELLDTATALSLVVGGIIAALAVSAFYFRSRQVLKQSDQDKKAAASTLVSKLGYKLQKEDFHEAYDVGNPFLNPILLTDIVLLEPVYCQVINSLVMFSRSHLESKTWHQRAAAAQNSQVHPVAELEQVKVATSGPPEDDGAVPSIPNELAPGDSGKGQQYVYMREFRAQYELFCIERGLIPVSSRNQIVHTLVDKFGVYTARESHFRMRGVRWRASPLPLKTDSLSVVSADDASGGPPSTDSNVAGQDEDNSLLMFCRACMEATGQKRRHFLDVEDDRSPSGQFVKGIRTRYLDYCAQQGLEPVDVDFMNPHKEESAEHGLLHFAWQNDSSFQEVTIQKIMGAKLYKQARLVTGWRSVLADVLKAVVHLAVLLLPAIVLKWRAMDAQQVYANTMAVNEPVQWLDFLGVPAPFVGFDTGGRDTLLLCSAVMSSQFVYVIFVLLRVLLHYLEVKNKVVSIYFFIFGIILAVEMALALTYVGVIAAWTILAMILQPTKFLANGTAVLVTLAVIVALWKQFKEVATHTKDVVFAKVDAKLQTVLQEVKARIEKETHDRAVDRLRLRKAAPKAKKKPKPQAQVYDESQAGFDDIRNEKTSFRVTPSDIFNLLDKDKSGTVSREEFRSLFENMDNKMSDTQIRKLLAYGDTDGSGRLTKQELEEAWSYIVDNLVNKALYDMGQSTTDMVLGIIAALALLVIGFAFIFLAMQGWYNDSSLQAVIQAALVAGWGRLSSSVQKTATPGDADMDALMADLQDDEDEGSGEGDD
eukprot:TRINITY_DN18762_c0_g1_i1.p1 TRINITY_DN18762_c0_g1~~TRINITY_DN18762_c0_g1_i1.p1  ORF type:complete len:1570 (-),score=301.84 TRINITY_DN18762_c0_g1_i1:81-4748(-)